MGMFDSILVKCPHCNNKLEFQSKSGPCMLASFEGNKIPLMVAISSEEDIVKCKKCKKNIQIEFDLPDMEVGYKLKITKEEEDYFG